MTRITRWKKGLSAVVGAGVLFQGVQCTPLDFQVLLNDFITTVASLLVSSFVSDIFGVTQSPF